MTKIQRYRIRHSCRLGEAGGMIKAEPALVKYLLIAGILYAENPPKPRRRKKASSTTPEAAPEATPEAAPEQGSEQ